MPEQGEILSDILSHILAIKRRRWVIARQVFAVVVFDHTPSHLIHAVDAEQQPVGIAARCAVGELIGRVSVVRECREIRARLD